ncbi:MAG: hypothetical protein VX255_03020, partial [Candidatus Latescibacterota bacterium]|nr:hypothetical protein [Candidatus Latescibacterota bacterium]
RYPGTGDPRSGWHTGGAIILREDVTQEEIRGRRQQLSQRLRDEIWRMRDADDMGRAVQSTFTLPYPSPPRALNRARRRRQRHPEGARAVCW